MFLTSLVGGVKSPAGVLRIPGLYTAEDLPGVGFMVTFECGAVAIALRLFVVV